tara:strand:- start:3879 stop:4496 length:618 start_codon:yes stop_codon:yes gene_type:complete
MSVNLPTHWNTSKVRAIELLVNEPTARIKDVAEESGVSAVTIHKWLKDPEFVEVFYQRYMISFGSRLPSVLNSMIREAEAGNVQAGRLVLEHSGKLIKRVEVANHQSPFEKFLNTEVASDVEIEPDEAEYVDIEPQIEVLPRKPQQVIESIKIQHQLKGDKRKTAKEWRERAMAVGVSILPRGRKTPAQKKEWQKIVIEKEKQFL